jgi:hypothetical protein
MAQCDRVTRRFSKVLVCTTISMAHRPLSGAAKTPLGPDQVNVLLLLHRRLDAFCPAEDRLRENWEGFDVSEASEHP